LVPREQDGVPFLEAMLPGAFRALFTTRVGGESEGSYSSMNLDLRSEDNSSAVERNRARLAGVISGVAGARNLDERTGSPASGLTDGRVAFRAQRVEYQLVSPAQVHGLRVVGTADYATQREEDGRRGLSPASCDGLTLHAELDRGLAPLLLFADCVPVIMVGEVDMAVVHGGWRGVLGGIVQQGAQAMTGPPGLAVIGPSIGPCCFTVAEEVAQAFVRRFGPEVVTGAADSPRVDLWAAAGIALAELGVRPHQVVNPRLCTVCNRDLFFSYRGDGPVTGRQGCLAWAVAA
jgi:copper oxidase (laccase) domain-containing protein